ncbi:Helix-turn-helix domain, rpiR family [Raoultella planticola]|uniref:Helix-turn-helix domain, rpiR family n=1 Tax=Raoultella planticola TaxID=575 RepID=A0A485A8A3_RAOPL|nr:Helix-turn-helix domain, rpiR family [Raoultella planticola]
MPHCRLRNSGWRIFIFDHFDDLISYNSAELAQLSGVSKATVSRLFKRLGYEKYKDMRDELRTLRQSGMPLTDHRDAVQGNTLLARHYKQEMANLTQWVKCARCAAVCRGD